MSDEKNNPKKPFLSLFEEVSHSHCCSSHPHPNGHHYEGMPEDDEEYEYDDEDDDEDDENETEGLTEEMDHEILMHRDSHFAGDFQVMIDYYQNESEHPGVNPYFDIERIEYLAKVEKELGQNLAPMLLTGPEIEKIAEARAAYRKLKEIYDMENPKNRFIKLIADLILTEKEDPVEEIDAVVAQGSAIVPDLIRILNSDDFFDPLFPGYGLSPFLAIVCLGLIKDERAVLPLFETIGKDMVFEEEIILDALSSIGDEAKKFLTKLIKSRPLTLDNTNAAYGLLAFHDDAQISEICLEQIKDPVVQKNIALASYLICNCLFLSEGSLRDEFENLASDTSLDEELREQMQLVIQEWK